MGRELKRVALDFDAPVGKTWDGYLNPHPYAEECKVCGGSGYSDRAALYAAYWYGHDKMRNGRPVAPWFAARQNPPQREHRPTDPAIMAFATNNVLRGPSYYIHGKIGHLGEPALPAEAVDRPEVQAAIQREAVRLCSMWKHMLMHNLTQDDVDALLRADRLMDFTHDWTPERRWQKKSPQPLVTADMVNDWSMSPGHMGHDSINQWIVIKDRCRRDGVPYECAHCQGEGHVWTSQEAKDLYESWEASEPPEGPGYQMWQTVSEGGPISPVCATAEELARYLVAHPYGVDKGTTFDQWMRFIEGPGWAPSIVGRAGGPTMSGVQGMVS